MSTPNTGKEEKQQDHLDTVGGYILQSLKKKNKQKWTGIFILGQLSKINVDCIYIKICIWMPIVANF